MSRSEGSAIAAARPIERESSQMHEQLSDLEERVNMLCSRLEPAMLPDGTSPAESSKAPADVPVCDIGASFRRGRERVNALRIRVQSIMDRLEV